MIALAAATATALGGCSVLGGGNGSSSSASSSSPSGTVTGDANEDGAQQADIDLDQPPKPIAEATVTNVSDDIDSTKIELLELRRDEHVMLATFRLTGTGRGNEKTSAFSLLGSSLQPVFIDMKNLEKYRHISDLTSDLSAAKAPLGQPVYVFTAFPPPRDGVASMDLRVTSGSPAIEDIPMPQ